MLKNNKTFGIALCCVLAVAAFFTSKVWTAPGSVTIAIILGILAGNLFGSRQKQFLPGANLAEKKLLPAAIALMGLSVYFSQIVSLSIPGALIVAATITTAVLSALLFGRLLGLKREFSLLIGTGNAVCGSSAIAATSNVLDVDDNEIGISISLVNLCGVVGIALIPFIAGMLDFSTLKEGELIGASLQAVGQVAAAGFAQSEPIGKTALIIKMARVLMLGPVVLFYALFASGQTDKNQPQTPWYRHVPTFIVVFFALALLNSVLPLPIVFKSVIKTASKALMLVSMAGIGLKINAKALLKQGPRALAVCLLCWACQITALCLLIRIL